MAHAPKCWEHFEWGDTQMTPTLDILRRCESFLCREFFGMSSGMILPKLIRNFDWNRNKNLFYVKSLKEFMLAFWIIKLCLRIRTRHFLIGLTLVQRSHWTCQDRHKSLGFLSVLHDRLRYPPKNDDNDGVYLIFFCFSPKITTIQWDNADSTRMQCSKLPSVL